MFHDANRSVLLSRRGRALKMTRVSSDVVVDTSPKCRVLEILHEEVVRISQALRIGNVLRFANRLFTYIPCGWNLRSKKITAIPARANGIALQRPQTSP